MMQITDLEPIIQARGVIDRQCCCEWTNRIYRGIHWSEQGKLSAQEVSAAVLCTMLRHVELKREADSNNSTAYFFIIHHSLQHILIVHHSLHDHLKTHKGCLIEQTDGPLPSPPTPFAPDESKCRALTIDGVAESCEADQL
jgi:hypothetical protein